jgi:hypothetical protein
MKINKILLGIMLACGVGSCSYLEVEPTDFISPSTYFTKEIEAERALNGVYQTLATQNLYGRRLVAELDLFCNDLCVQSSSSSIGVSFMDFTPSDPIVTGVWQSCYDGINRANIFLENIDRVPMDSAKKEIRKGEARFLRGLFYSILVQNWGAVPIKLVSTKDPDDIHIATSPAELVFDQIIADLKLAENVLPLPSAITSTERSGRASKTATQALLARVYLRRAGWPFNISGSYDKAADYAQKVIQSGEHDLNPSYTEVFMNIIQDKYDRTTNEIVFEVEFFGNGKQDIYTAYSNFMSYTVPYRINGQQVTWGLTTYNTTKYFNMFEVSDVRRDWNISPHSFKNSNLEEGHVAAGSTKRFIGKFYREYETYLPQYTNNSPMNFPLIRYPEVLLILAEAEAQSKNIVTDSAVWAINKVRTRAGASLYDKILDPTLADVSTFMDKIRDERARELFFEGHRRQDLIRWNIFVPVMKSMSSDANFLSTNAAVVTRVNEKFMIFPYPEKEMSTNNLMKGKQNVGW